MRKKERKEFDVSDIESQNGKTTRKKKNRKEKRRKNRKEKKKNGKRGNGTTSPQPHPKHTKPVEISRTNHDTQQ